MVSFGLGIDFSSRLKRVEKKKGRPGLAPLLEVMIYNLPAIPTAAATASLATPTATATKATAGTSFLGTRFIDR